MGENLLPRGIFLPFPLHLSFRETHIPRLLHPGVTEFIPGSLYYAHPGVSPLETRVFSESSALSGFSFIHFLSIQLLFDAFSISLRHLFEVLRPPFLLSSVGHEWEKSGTHVGEVTSKSSRNSLEMHSKRWLKGDESPWKRQICECEVVDNMRIKVECIH